MLRENKKALFAAGAAVLLLAVGAAAVLWMMNREDEGTVVYKETTVQHGSLTVGIEDSGSVEIGTVEQDFDLDVSEYTGGTTRNGGGGFMGMRPGNSQSSTGRKLVVEEVYASVGQKVAKGDPLFKLTDESVAEIREELEADLSSAQLTYEQLMVDQEKTRLEADHTYEQNRIYGNAATLEYDEAMYELQKAVDDAQEALEDAMEELADYQDDYTDVSNDYAEAKHYLTETEAAVAQDQEAYWYMKNEESREAAKKVVSDEEDKMEELEDQIREKGWEVNTLQIALKEAMQAYQEGEADAKLAYDKRVLSLNQADEIYGLATEQMDYEAKVAKEDYEDAKEKLDALNTYIVDGVVSAEYEGVITAVSILEGSSVKKGSAVITLNNFEDVTVRVDVSDDDMKSISVGDPVNLDFEAFPDTDFTGKVSDIGDATINSTTSEITYEVTITVDGDVSGLYHGMTVDVTFVSDEVRDVTYVSNRALTEKDGVTYVKYRDEQGEIQQKQVSAGFTDGNNTEIIEGLSEGDVVLVESRVKSE